MRARSAAWISVGALKLVIGAIDALPSLTPSTKAELTRKKWENLSVSLSKDGASAASWIGTDPKTSEKSFYLKNGVPLATRSDGKDLLTPEEITAHIHDFKAVKSDDGTKVRMEGWIPKACAGLFKITSIENSRIPGGNQTQYLPDRGATYGWQIHASAGAAECVKKLNMNGKSFCDNEQNRINDRSDACHSLAYLFAGKTEITAPQTSATMVSIQLVRVGKNDKGQPKTEAADIRGTDGQPIKFLPSSWMELSTKEAEEVLQKLKVTLIDKEQGVYELTGEIYTQCSKFLEVVSSSDAERKKKSVNFPKDVQGFQIRAQFARLKACVQEQKQRLANLAPEQTDCTNVPDPENNGQFFCTSLSNRVHVVRDPSKKIPIKIVSKNILYDPPGGPLQFIDPLKKLHDQVKTCTSLTELAELETKISDMLGDVGDLDQKIRDDIEKARKKLETKQSADELRKMRRDCDKVVKEIEGCVTQGLGKIKSHCTSFIQSAESKLDEVSEECRSDGNLNAIERIAEAGRRAMQSLVNSGMMNDAKALLDNIKGLGGLTQTSLDNLNTYWPQMVAANCLMQMQNVPPGTPPAAACPMGGEAFQDVIQGLQNAGCNGTFNSGPCQGYYFALQGLQNLGFGNPTGGQNFGQGGGMTNGMGYSAGNQFGIGNLLSGVAANGLNAMSLVTGPGSIGWIAGPSIGQNGNTGMNTGMIPGKFGP